MGIRDLFKAEAERLKQGDDRPDAAVRERVESR